MCGGGLRSYQGNGSEADIACLTESQRSRQICLTGRPAFGRAAPVAAMRRVIRQKSAEAIVAGDTSRGLREARVNNETGGLPVCDRLCGMASLL